MIPLHDIFDEDGMLTRTERLVLRRPVDDDMCEYIDTIVEDKPFLEDYKDPGERGETLRNGYWDSVISGESLFATICLEGNGAFIGYCSVEEPEVEPFELGINLRKKFQKQGFGPEAIVGFMSAIQAATGPKPFVAKIDVKNRNSQVMFRRLGFEPAGIDPFLIKDPKLLEDFESKYLDFIDDGMRELAAEFGVEPRKLLSHVLVFRKDV